MLVGDPTGKAVVEENASADKETTNVISVEPPKASLVSNGHASPKQSQGTKKGAMKTEKAATQPPQAAENLSNGKDEEVVVLSPLLPSKTNGRSQHGSQPQKVEKALSSKVAQKQSPENKGLNI